MPGVVTARGHGQWSQASDVSSSCQRRLTIAIQLPSPCLSSPSLPALVAMILSLMLMMGDASAVTRCFTDFTVWHQLLPHPLSSDGGSVCSSVHCQPPALTDRRTHTTINQAHTATLHKYLSCAEWSDALLPSYILSWQAFKIWSQLGIKPGTPPQHSPGTFGLWACRRSEVDISALWATGVS